jgi:NADH:ubiquinone oxidoreductase subunit
MGVVPPVPLLDGVRDSNRGMYYSIRTEYADCCWMRRFIGFDGKRHPSEVEAHLHAWIGRLIDRSCPTGADQRLRWSASRYD